MKPVYLFLMLTLLVACGHGKGEEQIIRNISKAIKIIDEKNESTFKKVEKVYLKDSTEREGRALYHKMKQVEIYTTAYQAEVMKAEEANYATLNRKYTDQCFQLLTPEEKTEVLHELEGLMLVDSTQLEVQEYTAVIPHELSLEAEMLLKEVYQVLMEDFRKKKHKLDWNIIYDEHHHK